MKLEIEKFIEEQEKENDKIDDMDSVEDQEMPSSQLDIL